MITFSVQHDPKELADLERRINESIRHLGSSTLLADLEQYIKDRNRKEAFAGLDRYGRPLRPWRVRSGVSDFHGKRYSQWTNRTTLLPFGRQSRRIAAFEVETSRRSILSVGFGKVTLRAGWGPRAGQVFDWQAQRFGRDVRGMTPRTRKGVQRLLHRHATYSHRLLKRGAAAAGGAARRTASFLGL